MTLPHPCLDCGALSRGSRCPRCQSAREAARGSTTERGDGARWQRTSARALPVTVASASSAWPAARFSHDDGPRHRQGERRHR